VTIDASLLLQAAATAAGAQQYPAGALYVVATPIGNLADVTLRAIHVLALVDAVACEDTRVSATLLRHLGLSKPLLAAHEHNEREAAKGIVARLVRGERVAYVSDAGTPAVSDPGSTLVAMVQAAGLRTIPIPGPSAALAALSTAGAPANAAFRFAGFVGNRTAERASTVADLAAARETQILFEAPHRIEALARELAQTAGERTVTVCRELTKQFETIVTLPCRELPVWLAADANRLRGEFVLVLHGLTADTVDRSEVESTDRTLRLLLAELPLKQAVALAVQLTGAPRNQLYERALALRANAED
jgi:16S rRNA (cytidine1402-2'-O)-methyltransferase